MKSPKGKPLNLTPILSIPPDHLERIRQAVLTLRARGDRPTVERVRQEARVNQVRAGLVLRAVRLGHLDPAETWCAPETKSASSATRDPLPDMIRSAKTHADRTAIHQEVAARIPEHSLDSTEARTIKELLGEARQSDKAAQESASPDDVFPVLLCTKLGYSVTKVFDRIVDDEIRQGVVDFLVAEAERDLRENPNPTPAEIEKGA